jgi:hypothetical protein
MNPPVIPNIETGIPKEGEASWGIKVVQAGSQSIKLRPFLALFF